MSLPTVLVVDDIEGVHEMLDIVFGDAGYQVEHATSAQEALARYERRPTDVVFSDIQMPGMDGLELLRQLCQVDPDVVVIMTTALDSKQYAIQSLRLGAFDYVEKPYDETALAQTINRALRHRRARLESPKTTAATTTHGSEELTRLQRELKASEQQIAKLAAHNHELEATLSQQRHAAARQEDSQRSLRKRQQDLELREDALKVMNDTLQERMQVLKSLQRERRNDGELTPEADQALRKLRSELQARESELEALQSSIIERERFLQESEESLFEKGQQLTELQAELEQMREDLDARQRSASLSSQDMQEIATLKADLQAKENALQETEASLNEREESVRRASALLKAREKYLLQSETILFGSNET